MRCTYWALRAAANTSSEGHVTDIYDRATEREEANRADALAAQQRRAGLLGKTIDDSANECQVCDDPIPQARRRALPGVQTCVDCQADLELALKKGNAS